MKKAKKILAGVLAFTSICASGALHLISVSAGVSDINIVTSSSFKYSVSTADWLVSGVGVQNRSLYFSPDGTEDDRIISKRKIENLKDLGYTECFTSELTITPVALADTFYIMFGIDGLSGLKTAAINLLHHFEQTGEDFDRALFAARYTFEAVEAVVKKAEAAFKENEALSALVVSGGVAANSHVRARLAALCKKLGKTLYLPPLSLCGDNGAMIAAQGYYEFIKGKRADSRLNASAADEE